MPEPLNPCPRCGEHTNPHILADVPDCPHGWEAADVADLADVYADAWTQGES